MQLSKAKCPSEKTTQLHTNLQAALDKVEGYHCCVCDSAAQDTPKAAQGIVLWGAKLTADILWSKKEGHNTCNMQGHMQYKTWINTKAEPQNELSAGILGTYSYIFSKYYYGRCIIFFSCQVSKEPMTVLSWRQVRFFKMALPLYPPFIGMKNDWISMI